MMTRFFSQDRESGPSVPHSENEGRIRLEFDDEFADVVAAEEHVDGFGGLFEAVNDGLFVFQFAGHFPHAELFGSIHEFRGVVEDDEAFDAKAFDENLGEAGEARILPGVTGNKTA